MFLAQVMYQVAHHADILREHKSHGFATGLVNVDWALVKQRRDAYLRRLNGIYSRNLESSHVQYIQGRAEFVSANEVLVGDDIYAAPHIVVATGARPRRLTVAGHEHTITSDEFFELNTMPKKAMVISWKLSRRAWLYPNGLFGLL
jgi:glutathione reductase (NADPH)